MGAAQFAREFEDQLASAGAFAIRRRGDPARLKLKVATGYDVSGTVLWPIGLGQPTDDPANSYGEDVVALVEIGGSFNRGRVVASEAPLQLCLTRHSLERLIERGAIDSNLERSLPPLSQQLARDAGLALAFGITKEERGDDWQRTTFLPMTDGAVVLTNRLVLGPGYAEDFGWKFNFNKHRYKWGNLKKDLLVADPTGMSRVNGSVLVSSWFATTFLSSSQLSIEQRNVLDDLRLFFSSASNELAAHAAKIMFDPEYSFRPTERAPGAESVESFDLERLQSALQSDVFRAHRRQPIAMLLEADTSMSSPHRVVRVDS